MKLIVFLNLLNPNSSSLEHQMRKKIQKLIKYDEKFKNHANRTMTK